MGGRAFSISTELTEVALSAATIKTVLEFTAPTNIGVDVLGFSISFDGIVVTNEPVEISLARKSVAGTGGTAVTERDYDEDHSGTIQTAATVNRSTEGTVSYDFHPRNVHPQGLYEIWFPRPLKVEPGGILGIRANAPAAVNCHAEFILEE